MNSEIYIRPLEEKDAEVSYNWRNDADIWRYTESRADTMISLEVERDWIRKVLVRHDEKRFAICIKGTNEYIGNVQLTGINSYEAEFHIFIGEKKYWGRGIGTAATNLIIEYAFEELNLQSVYLFVKKENISAIRAYEKAGFYKITEDENDYVRLATYALDKRKKALVSVFMMAYNHERYISQAIEGILIQETDFEVEIVVGEDKSTDNTRNILLDYAEKYPLKFKLILHKENVGAAKNQTSVFNTCRGKYIAICEGDDYWTDPMKLQKQVDFLEANPDFAICFHRVEMQYEDESKKSELSNPNQKDITTFDDLTYDNYIHTLSTVFRNGLFDKFPEGALKLVMGDWTIHLLNAQHGKIKFLEDTMAVYRRHSGGAWGMKSGKEQMLRLFEAVEFFTNYFHPKGEKGFKTLGGYLLSELCYSAFEEGSYAESREYCRKGIAFSKYLSLRKKNSLIIRYFLCSFPRLAEFYKSTLKTMK